MRNQSNRKKSPQTKPSPQLKELLLFENQLPLDFKIKYPHSFSSSLENADVESIIEDLPTELRHLVKDGQPWKTLENYYSLGETLLKLRDCVKYLEWELSKIENYRKASAEEQEMVRKSIAFNEEHFGRRHQMFEQQNFLDKPLIRVEVVGDPYSRILPTFGQSYILDFKSSYLMTILRGVDVRRLRTCKQCEHIFWAVRLNQTWCSSTCSNRYHQIKLRSDPKRLNKVNEDRRRNYAYKATTKK